MFYIRSQWWSKFVDREWLLPTFGTLLVWGFWGFIPKITTQYISPKSAILYEVIGGAFCVSLLLISWRHQVEVEPQGVLLAFTTGMLGVGGAYLFLTAVDKGPVTLVSTISALYPVLTVFLAIAFLHESLSLRQAVGVGFAILSVVLIAL